MTDTKDLKLFIHVGMGKTGTTAVQRALRQSDSSGLPASQGARYLGSFFDFLGPPHAADWGSLAAAIRGNKKSQLALADAFHAYLVEESARSGNHIFIFSNEALTGVAKAARPFFEAIVGLVPNTRIVITLRKPLPWLISAYKQWGVNHKINPGKIQGIRQRAGRLLKQYRGVANWVEIFPNQSKAILIDQGEDVTKSVSNIVGLQLIDVGRIHESLAPAELLLRALFNNEIADKALPKDFDRVTQLTGRNPPERLNDMYDLIFNYGNAEELVRDELPLLQEISALTGVDLSSDIGSAPGRPEADDVRSRLFDYVVWLTLKQAERITALEGRITELSGRR